MVFHEAHSGHSYGLIHVFLRIFFKALCRIHEGIRPDTSVMRLAYPKQQLSSFALLGGNIPLNSGAGEPRAQKGSTKQQRERLLQDYWL